MKKNNCKNFIFILVSFIVIFSNLLFFTISDKDLPDVSNERESNTIGMLVSDLLVEQTFIAEHNGLTSVDILLATYNRVNNSNVTIQLSNDKNQVIYSNTFSAAELQDNAFYHIDFDTISNSKNKEYKIILSSDTSDVGNAITAWTSNSDNYKIGKLYINNQDVGYDLAFKTFYSLKTNSGPFVIFLILVLFSYVLLVLFFWNFVSKRICSNVVSFVFLICSSICLAFVFTSLYNYIVLMNIEIQKIFCKSGLLRTAIFFIPSFFLTSFFYFPKSMVIDFLLKNRWKIACIIFFVGVCLNLNISNVPVWNDYIQPSVKTDLSEPIIGVGRSIRGDEWLVDLTRKATGELVGYGAENYIFRGTFNSGLSASGLYLSYSALSNPLNWGYYLLGFERGTSFYWIGILVFGFMISFELCYIISNRKSLYALFGAAIIVLSQFLLWWSIPIIWIALQSIVICIYYFINAEKRAHKIFLSIGVALSCACFITTLYPAWQVPLAYVLIALFVWIVVDNWKKIKGFKAFDWVTVACAFVFMVSIVFSYFSDNKFYMENIMKTIYPGQRISSGGWILDKAFNYPLTLLFPYKETTNPCEAGTMFDLFPIPIIITIVNLIYQVTQKVQKKYVKFDFLNLFLFSVSLLIFIYCSFGMSSFLSKISLFSYSTPERAVDVLGLLCVLMMIRNLGMEHHKTFKIPSIISVIISLLVVMRAIYYSNSELNGYMSTTYISFISIFIFVLSNALFNIFHEKIKKSVIIITTAIIAISGLSVLPINSGVEALKNKPVAIEIQKIVEEDPEAIWASTYWFASNFIAANGGRCITSTNYIPNMELWTELDPDGLYSDIYNRYAHINFLFTDEITSFELLGMDSISLILSKSDLSKCKVKYIYSAYTLLNDSDIVDFELLYNEYGAYIYKINYL